MSLQFGFRRRIFVNLLDCAVALGAEADQITAVTASAIVFAERDDMMDCIRCQHDAFRGQCVQVRIVIQGEDIGPGPQPFRRVIEGFGSLVPGCGVVLVMS